MIIAVHPRMETNERRCRECSKTLRGRLDKKFCDDYCRNAFNNKQNSQHNNYVRSVNSRLRRNRNILAQLLPQAESNVRMPRQRLLESGFDLRYHTHQYTNPQGQVYSFCYDYGFLPLANDQVLVVRTKAGV